MSDDIRAEIKASAKALCHYPSGPSSVNSCCQGIARCEMDAAIGEIARLRAALATARREGMEAAVSEAQARAKFWVSGNNEEAKIRYDEARKIAAAICAAAKEMKP